MGDINVIDGRRNLSTMKSAAAVFRRKGVLIVHSYAQTITGVYIATQPFILLRDDIAATAVLGEAVRKAVSASSTGVAVPVDTFSVTAPLLSAAGVKTWGKFVIGARMSEVRADGSNL